MEKTKYSWENREAQIASLIRRHEPEILTLQECKRIGDHKIETFMGTRLSNYKYELFRAGKNNEEESNSLVIAYNPEYFEYQSSGKRWLSEKTDVFSDSWGNGNGRIVAYMQLKSKLTNKILYVFTCHYSLNEHAREMSSQILPSLIKKIVGDIENTQILLTGDFNMESDDEKAYKNLISNNIINFNDHCQLLLTENGNKIDGTFVGSGRDQCEIYKFQGHVLANYDRIFGYNTRPTVFEAKNYCFVLLDDPNLGLKNEQPSDHLPLLSTFLP
jgi:endonuclease/exonuclease/phosphatase family metal-dependent hydrolase